MSLYRPESAALFVFSLPASEIRGPLDHRGAIRGDDLGRRGGFAPQLRQIRAGAYHVDGGLVGVVGLILLSQLCVACRCRVIFEGDGLGRCGAFWPNLSIQPATLFAAGGFIIPGLSEVAKAKMFKLHFGVSAARCVKRVIHERICAVVGCMMVGLLTTIALLFCGGRSCSCRFIGALGGRLYIPRASLVFFNRRILTRYPIFNVLISALVGVGQFNELSFYALVQPLLMSTTFLLLSRAMAISIEPVLIFLYMPLIFFVTSLPIFYMGWEAIVMMTLGDAAHVSNSKMLALSAAFGVVVFLASLPGAALWRLRPSMRQESWRGRPSNDALRRRGPRESCC
jgi:hypothetical protein